MGKTKRELKFFSITQYREEEEYLSGMHRKGWKLTRVIFPGIYCFEECEPENVSYRLDYNKEGIANKEEYVRMFEDCEWEYLFDFVGYSYFRKASKDVGGEEIFCDDESRLDMMRRVYRGRVIPLIIVFFCIIIPQLLINTQGHTGNFAAQRIFSVTFIVLGIIYLLLFSQFSVRFYRYENKMYPGNKKIKMKYACIFIAILICSMGIAAAAHFGCSSDYDIKNSENGFVLKAERLNKTIVKEYDLNSGDIVAVTHDSEGGIWDVRIEKYDEKPVFFGNTYNEFEDFAVEIHEAGVYKIECRGRNARGDIAVEIK